MGSSFNSNRLGCSLAGTWPDCATSDSFSKCGRHCISTAVLRICVAVRSLDCVHRLENRHGCLCPQCGRMGLGFLTGTTWDPNKGQYGILPEIWGTLYSSLLALVIGTAFGLAAAVFLSEGYLGIVCVRNSQGFSFAFPSGMGQACRIVWSNC